MDQINEIVEKNLVDTVFQPIIELSDGEIIGYEAYSRGPEGSDMYRPYKLISEAKSHNMLGALDRLFRDNAIANASKRGLATSRLLFINVDPAVFYDEEHGRASIDPGKSGIAAESIVIEISENSAVCNFPGVFKHLHDLQQEGFRIAVDDTGASFSDITSVIQVSPDYLKIDNFLIRGIDADVKKQEAVRSIRTIAGVSGTRLIAEGVETDRELLTLMELNVYAAQGNFIGKPARGLEDVNPEVVRLIRDYFQRQIDKKIMDVL